MKPSVVRARIERANALREALGLDKIDVLRGVRAMLGKPDRSLRHDDYRTATRWFSPTEGRGPSDAALVWLEAMAMMEGLAIAKPRTTKPGDDD